MTGPAPLLEVDDLAVTFAAGGARPIPSVRDVSLRVRRGEVLALVGESGSGKSVTAMTLLGLTRSRGTAISGRATFDGIDLLGASERELRRIRGSRIAMIFQDPMSALNPVLQIGEQITEQLRAHRSISRAAARTRAEELLGEVGIPRARERLRSYPHEFSGGMRQRVMIAMALSCEPELLIADEPTTALDVTVQAQILDLMSRLKEEREMGILLVTHDLGVVAETADDVAVMYGGRIVERGPVRTLFADPQHPYTWGLLGSIPPTGRDRPDRLPTIPGTPPTPTALPAGCPFSTRCPHVFERCAELPPLDESAPGHADRCWLSPEDARARRLGPDGLIGLFAPAREEDAR